MYTVRSTVYGQTPRSKPLSVDTPDKTPEEKTLGQTPTRSKPHITNLYNSPVSIGFSQTHNYACLLLFVCCLTIHQHYMPLFRLLVPKIYTVRSTWPTTPVAIFVACLTGLLFYLSVTSQSECSRPTDLPDIDDFDDLVIYFDTTYVSDGLQSTARTADITNSFHQNCGTSTRSTLAHQL